MPLGHGCPHRYAYSPNFEHLTEVLDTRGISSPKTSSLGCLFIPEGNHFVFGDACLTSGRGTDQVKTRQVNLDHFSGHFRGHFRGRLRGTFRGSFGGESLKG